MICAYSVAKKEKLKTTTTFSVILFNFIDESVHNKAQKVINTSNTLTIASFVRVFEINRRKNQMLTD